MKALGGNNLSLRASHQLHTVTSSSLNHSWGPFLVALRGRDPSEPLELKWHPWVRGVRITLAHRINGLFGRAGACLEGEDRMVTQRAPQASRRAIKHLAAHKQGQHRWGHVSPAGKWDKPVPGGHQGHSVPTAEWTGQTEGSSRRWGGKGKHGVGTGKRDPQHLHSLQPRLGVSCSDGGAGMGLCPPKCSPAAPSAPPCPG